jgi:hypothetical protein
MIILHCLCEAGFAEAPARWAMPVTSFFVRVQLTCTSDRPNLLEADYFVELRRVMYSLGPKSALLVMTVELNVLNRIDFMNRYNGWSE